MKRFDIVVGLMFARWPMLLWALVFLCLCRF